MPTPFPFPLLGTSTLTCGAGNALGTRNDNGNVATTGSAPSDWIKQARLISTISFHFLLVMFALIRPCNFHPFCQSTSNNKSDRSSEWNRVGGRLNTEIKRPPPRKKQPPVGSCGTPRPKEDSLHREMEVYNSVQGGSKLTGTYGDSQMKGRRAGK